MRVERAYKGYTISPTSRKLVSSGKWTVEVTVTKDHGDSVTQKKFSAANTFANEAEATEQCIQFAKQIIDGKSSTCTVDDM